MVARLEWVVARWTEEILQILGRRMRECCEHDARIARWRLQT